MWRGLFAGDATKQVDASIAARTSAYSTVRGRAETDTYINVKTEILTPLYLLATDCLRLSMHFFHPIQQCAQQVYHTAVPLSPTSSLLHKSCLQSVIDNQLSYVTAFSGAPGAWGSLLRTIDIRPRKLTCIKASFQRIIAACEEVINIYDAVTFVLRQSLCAPETVTGIEDSPDGSILFFVHSFTVTMWDTQTGGLIHTFATKSEINDVAVSSTHIACGMSDGSVTHWNIHTKVEGGSSRSGRLVIAIFWLSPQEIAVATQSTLYICDVIVGDILGRFSIPGHVWGVVYLEAKNEYLVGTSPPSWRGDQEESFFVRCQLPKLDSHQRKLFRFKFKNLGWSTAHSGQLSSPTLVGEDIVCITPPNGVQLFNTSSYKWTNSPPLLSAATSVAVSLNRNLVVQTKDSVQIFSVSVLTSVLTSGEAHNVGSKSHIYPLGENHIICVLQPTRRITLLQLETLEKVYPDDDTLPPGPLIEDQLASVHALFGYGLVAEFGLSTVVEAWQTGTPLPEWTETAEEGVSLYAWSPECTKIVMIHHSPRQELWVKDVKGGAVLANLYLGDDDLGVGEVYDIAFDSEAKFHLKIDGPEQHIQIPYEINVSPCGHYSHTITKGEPVLLPKHRAIPPYTLDKNCEWVLDAKSRKICWISPGDIRRGDGGHCWAGLSLVMVGDDGVIRKLTFKDPEC